MYAQSSVTQLMPLVANEPLPQIKIQHERREVGNTSTID